MTFRFALPLVLIFLGSFLIIEAAGSAETTTERFKEVIISGKYKEEIFGGKIDKKEPVPGKDPYSDKYLIGDSARFELIDGSVLLDQSGRNISPDKLRVPCKAMVNYQVLSNGRQNILALQVSKLLSGSTDKWSEALPD